MLNSKMLRGVVTLCPHLKEISFGAGAAVDLFSPKEIESFLKDQLTEVIKVL